MSEWINVRDKLPKKSLAVLLLSHRHIPVVGYLFDGYGFRNAEGDEIGYVTHWMNIPTLPED